MSHLTKQSLREFIEAMMADLKSTDFQGIDVEVRIKYDRDQEGADILYLAGNPLVKFTLHNIRKEGKASPDVKLTSYMDNVVVPDDDEELL